MIETYAFDFDPRFRRFLGLFGINPGNSHVTVDEDVLSVKFGRWGLSTPLSNIRSVEVTGPYLPVKALGVRLALTNTGLTFGSGTRGVCLTFREPVRGFGPRRNGSLTVTLADPENFAARFRTGQPPR
ncbi:MAG: hypothetical protein ABIS86_10445 [Streptosporangiaceae bacterium]